MYYFVGMSFDNKRLNSWVRDRGFLAKTQVSDITLTDMSGGMTRVRDDNTVETGRDFFTIYGQDIASGVHHYLSEVANPACFRAFLDLDFLLKTGVKVRIGGMPGEI